MIFCWDGDLDIKNNWPHFDYLHGQHWNFLKYSEHARYLPLKIKLQRQTTLQVIKNQIKHLLHNTVKNMLKVPKPHRSQ